MAEQPIRSLYPIHSSGARIFDLILYLQKLTSFLPSRHPADGVRLLPRPAPGHLHHSKMSFTAAQEIRLEIIYKRKDLIVNSRKFGLNKKNLPKTNYC